jgi:hypothetical protein
MALSLSAADWLAKKLYADGLDKEMLVYKNPFLRHMEHETDFASNKGMDIPAPYVNAQGIGPDNATAFANESASAGVMFTVPQRHIIGGYVLDSDLVRNTLAGGSEAQFTNILQREVDGATEQFGQELNQRAYGTNDGARSLVHASTAPSTTTLTLANPEDAQFYEPGMKIAAFDTATGTLRNSGASVLVTKVDPIAGTLTGSTNWTTTIAALAVGDSLIRAGMNTKDLDGIKGWVPSTVSGSDSFLGVNRSVYRTRLAGVYVDVSAYNIRTAFLKAFAVARNQISGFDSKAPIFINPANLMSIKQSVEAVKIVDTTMDDKYNIGLDVCQVLGYNFVEDRHCPLNECFVVPGDAFSLGSAGKQPYIDDQDGKKFNYNRQTGKLEFVVAFDGNTFSRATNSLMRVKLPAPL